MLSSRRCFDEPDDTRFAGGIRRAGFLLAATLCTLVIVTSTNGQIPILYYDFENNASRTTFENLVEQAVNSGSAALTRAGNTTTISSVAGAGTFNGGAATGQAATGSNWDSSTSDPGSAATNYYQFVVNTSGFSQISIAVDQQASASGPARVGVLFSINGSSFSSATTTLTGNALFSAATFDLSAISAIDNQAAVTVRLYSFAGSAADRAGRSAFASGGTFRIDNVVVLAASITASKTLLDYPAIGLSIKSGTPFTPAYSNFAVNGAGITVSLASELRIAGALTVSNGMLNCGANIVSGTGSFTVAPGATLGVGSPSGVTASGATGNIQTAIRNFDPGANYSYIGGSTQITGNGLPSTVHDLTINSGAGVSLSSGVAVNGSLILTAGTFTLGANSLTVMNPIGGTPANLNADGTSSLTITGSASGIDIPGSISTLNNLTLNNSSGSSLLGNLTIIGTLGLINGDLATGSFTLIMGNGSMSSGAGDVVGNVNRADLSGASTRSFGNPNVQITITAGTVSSMTVNLIKASPADFGNAARRTYTLKDVAGTLGTATVRLHYLDSELNGNSEASLELWRKDGTSWVSQGATNRDSTDNWVEKTLITSFSPWTISGPSGPTYVAMIGYSAVQSRDGKLLFQWETGEEVNNLGFNIYRETGGSRTRINESLIIGSGLTARPGTVMTAGRSYVWQAERTADDDSSYWIESIDLNGSTVWHGPIFKRIPTDVVSVSVSERAISVQTLTLKELAIEGALAGATVPVSTTTRPVDVTAGQTNVQLGLASQDAVKISVKHEGWYRIGKTELMAAGLSSKADPRSLQLYTDGVEVPLTITPDPLKFDSTSSIEFYALSLDTQSTDQRVYWLISAKTAGKRIPTHYGSGGTPQANGFLSTVQRRDRSIYLSGIQNGDTENFFGAPVGSVPVDQVITLKHIDRTAPGYATLEVGMQGFSLTPHSVSVSLNGNALGVINYQGSALGVMQFTVPNRSLFEGQNVVTLAGQQGVVDVSLVDHIRVSYWRMYSADSNTIRFTAPGNQRVTITGFTSGDVRVLDLTSPSEPSFVSAEVVGANDEYSVVFGVPGTGDRTLVAFGGDQIRGAAGLVANQTSRWRSAANHADLIIITHRSLTESLTRLAAHRQMQGLKVARVDVEDIYDEFGFGNKSPQAIRDFLSYASTNWRQAPRYVVLAGSASYDPKNYNGLSSYDLVPTKLIDTSLTETASDDWFVDFDLDGIPELAMGRLPCHTLEEATNMVAKLISYENDTQPDSVLLVADENLGFDFEGANHLLAPLFPDVLTVEQINRGQLGTSAARQRLLAGIASGQKIVNYAGHGSPSGWRSSLLTAADALALTNAGRYPLFVLMTCLNGEFQHPQLNPLATALMKVQQGGAIAVWASSGLTEPPSQSIMNERFYMELFRLDREGNGPRLGDATLRAKSVISDPDVRRTWILFGDPSMRLR